MLLTEQSEIRNTKTIVKVKCDYCGDIIEKSYLSYTRGRSQIDKDACKKCVGLKCAEASLLKRQNSLFQKMVEMCELNGDTLITKKDEIKGNTTYISYRCRKHGEQTSKIANYLSGKRCSKCQAENARDRNKMNKEIVIDEIVKCGGELLNPDDYRNRSARNLMIKCPACRNAFTTSLVLFTQHGGQVCSSCRSSESIGEMRIRKYLENNGIEFKQEHWFSDCRDIYPLPFDFYLPKYNRVIEFDGRQHFADTNLFSYSLEKIKAHDEIKNQYCKDKGIDIIRIPYTKINHINEILDITFT